MSIYADDEVVVPHNEWRGPEWANVGFVGRRRTSWQCDTENGAWTSDTDFFTSPDDAPDTIEKVLVRADHPRLVRPAAQVSDNQS